MKLEEHAADICHAICWVIPGLSRLLLPRINSMVLLAAVTSTMLVLCEHFRCISEASTIDGVLEIRSRHFWQLDFGQL
ncbi:hypothetical protein TELCIR_10063, partial [Teladorsagia circumcincta]